MVSLSTTKHNTLLPRAIRSVWFSSGLFGAVALSGAVASQQAHAFSFEDFKQVVSATASIKQADNVTAALEVVNAQTAQTPKDISDRNMEVEANVLAIKDGIQNGKEIVKSIEDFKPGVGIPNSMDCMAMEEQKDHTVKKELSNQVATAIASSNAAKFFAQEGNKRALRAKDHYSNYCDISEVAQGICLSSPNARSGMNQDYTNIFANKTMNEEQINAGYSFTRNIIDPAKTDDSFCKNVTCKALAENEKQYATLGSMIQNAFLQQIQDGVPYETPPGGAVPVVVEQLGEISPEYNGPYKLWDETAVQGGPPGDGTVMLDSMADISGIKPGKFTGFDPEMDALIKEASQKYGVDEKTMRGLIKMEAGWQGAMSQTGALGPGQFVKGTWNDLARTAEGRAIGMRPIGSCYQKACDPRRDRRINTLATALLMKNNAAFLKRKGIEVTPENLYMTHNMGPGFVAAVYGKGKFGTNTAKNIGYNGGKKRTPQEFMEYQKGKFRQNYVDANQPGVYNGG